MHIDVGGDVRVNLVDSDVATNTILVGFLGGTSIDYIGGDGPDALGIANVAASSPTFTAALGLGGDSLAVATVGFASLRADFGGGGEESLEVGPNSKLSYDAQLLNMNDFNHFYTVNNDLWNIVQLADVGDVTLDNNGDGNAVQVRNGKTAQSVSYLQPITCD